MPPVRAFIAIPLPPGVIDAARRVQRELADRLPGVRWVRPETMHLTLRFFGDVEQETLDEIAKVMLSVERLQPPFRLQASGIGAFPSPGRAKVIWLGIKGETDALQQLHASLEARLETIGIPAEDRPFSPHLTLGRARRRLPPAQPILAPYADASCGNFTVRALALFESRLRPDGALHIPLKTIELGGR